MRLFFLYGQRYRINFFFFFYNFCNKIGNAATIFHMRAKKLTFYGLKYNGIHLRYHYYTQKVYSIISINTWKRRKPSTYQKTIDIWLSQLWQALKKNICVKIRFLHGFMVYVWNPFFFFFFLTFLKIEIKMLASTKYILAIHYR